MDTNNNIVKILNDEIPADVYADISYRITSTTAPFVIIISDGENNTLNLSLLKRDNKNAYLIKRINSSFDVNKLISDGIAATLQQSLKISRRYSMQNDKAVINIFQNIFQGNNVINAHFVELNKTIINNGDFSIQKVKEIISRIVENSVFNYYSLNKELSKKTSFNPVLQFYAYTMIQWCSFISLLKDFINEQTESTGENIHDLQIFMCGRIKNLISVLEPSCGRVKNINFSPKNCENFYKITESILSPDKDINIFININEEIFDALVLNYYNRLNNTVLNSTQTSTVHIFNDKVTGFNKLPVIYAGNINGQQLPFNSDFIFEDEEDSLFLMSPFSEDFSTVIAMQKVKILKMLWEKENESDWKFSVEFMYNNHKYRPEPKIFSKEDIVISDFPEIIIYQLEQNSNLNICSTSEDINVQIFNGKKINDDVVINSDTKEFYLAFYKNEEFLGQIDYSFMQRRH